MRNRFLMTSAALVLGLSLVGAACSDDESADETTTTRPPRRPPPPRPPPRSPRRSSTSPPSNDNFSTLVTAVTEAGLAETLSGEGPFTVMAPTNAAFEAVPAGTLDTLLPTRQVTWPTSSSST